VELPVVNGCIIVHKASRVRRAKIGFGREPPFLFLKA
jgi:hypothetical protein